MLTNVLVKSPNKFTLNNNLIYKYNNYSACDYMYASNTGPNLKFGGLLMDVQYEIFSPCCTPKIYF